MNTTHRSHASDLTIIERDGELVEESPAQPFHVGKDAQNVLSFALGYFE